MVMVALIMSSSSSSTRDGGRDSISHSTVILLLSDRNAAPLIRAIRSDLFVIVQGGGGAEPGPRYVSVSLCVLTVDC